MNHSVYLSDLIVTADGRELGTVKGLYRRLDQDEVDPDLKLFSDYLEVVNLEFGDDFYIPTDYIASREGRKLILKQTTEEVMAETLTRQPQFIAHGQSSRVHLPNAPRPSGQKETQDA